MKHLLTLILLLISSEVFSDLDAFFKIPANKPESCCMRNIDYIYMLNLDQRPEKYQSTLQELQPYDIQPYRFSAVNGWELSLETINQVGVKYDSWMRQNLMGTTYLPEMNGNPHHEILHVDGRNYFCHCMSPGAVGIALSHLSILKDAYDSGYETIWVMEDDIQVIKNPHLLSDLVEHLDNLVGKGGWDFLFTDMDTKNRRGEYVPCTGAALRPNFSPAQPDKFQKRFDISPEFRKIGARYGAYSVIVRRSGMKKVLDFMKDGIFLPYDMEFPLPDNIRLFTVRDDVVSTKPDALSDNGAPNYKLNLVQP